MRSSVARRGTVPLAIDTAIALTCVCTIAYFIVIIEYCIGRDELTRAELQLLGPEPQSLHAYADKKTIGRD